uniref:Uncharacterized protein n=1 Tax=Panagrolaimus davidi TaxID=227884 RepID=A0A914P5Y8_9BILA
MKNTSTITLTSKNITLINLDHHRYASINFWAKKESFTFYINASDCINKTASTWFIIGGGEPIGFTETIDLKDAKIKVTVNLNKSEVYFIKGNYISMGNITTFPYHANGTEPRVKFFAVNAGNCKLIYEMPKEIVPLIAATRRHDNENKTATTEISLTKVTETWYDPSTLKQIGFAYLWILTCVL